MKTKYLVLQALVMLAIGVSAGCGDDEGGGAAACGNGLIEQGEGCDFVVDPVTQALTAVFPQGMNSCQLVYPTMPNGTIGCLQTCQIDPSTCTAGAVTPPPPGTPAVGGVGGAGAPPPIAPPPAVTPPAVTPPTGGAGI